MQLVWSREDDMTHDFYRPASYHRMSGAVDAEGNILGWRHKSTSTSIAEWWEKKSTPESSELGCTLQMPYLVNSYKLEYLPAASGVPRAWWRSVEASVIGFVMESFMDELAHAAGVDPYKFRMQKLTGERLVKNPLGAGDRPLDTARMKGVLQLAAEKGDWGKALPAGHGRGIACSLLVRELRRECRRSGSRKRTCASEPGGICGRYWNGGSSRWSARAGGECNYLRTNCSPEESDYDSGWACSAEQFQ